MTTRRPTMQDVADLAGVSKMAVSVVLNGTKSTVGVSEATRARIRRALEELQYEPNAVARSLRLKRTDMVGVYSSFGFGNTGDPFVREVFNGLTEGLTTHRKDLLLYTAPASHNRRSHIERILGSKVDAAIVLPGEDDLALLQELRRGNLPCIVIAEPVQEIRCVTADDAGGSRALARHLIARGHRRILYRRPAADNPCEVIRFAAFRAEVESAGGQVIAQRAREPMDSVTDVEEALLMDRAGDDRITAVACWRDYSALRALNFCRVRGLAAPQEIAIAGFDGLAYPGMPPGTALTTVAAHWRAIARTAADNLAAILAGDDSIPQQTIVPADLVVGNTT